MVQPGVYNIKLQRRADYSVLLQFLDSSGTPINLTGWSAASQIWDGGRTTKYADFAVSYIDRLTGTIQISLTNEQTTSLPNQAFYDVQLTSSTGIKEYYLEGSINTNEGYTA